MTVDGAVELFTRAFIAAMKFAGPMLLVALTVGVVVGVLQAATQVNESSVSFGAKLLAVGLTFAVLGKLTDWLVVAGMAPFLRWQDAFAPAGEH